MSEDAPDLYKAYLRLSNASDNSALDKAIRELVNIRASQLNGCAYCLEMHTRDALAAGESDRRLHSIAAWPESPVFSERERAALALTEALTLLPRGGLDASYEAAAEHFGATELAALLYAIVAINGWNRLAVATHAVFEG